MFFQKTKIEQIATHCGVLSAFPSEHLLFAVEGGAGKLRTVWYDNGKNAAFPYDGNTACALLLEDTPLLQIQSSGCPTCESLLAAGYGLPENSREVQQMRDALNQPYTGLADALSRLRPLLALLQSGVYVLTSSGNFPTNGEGRFFWDVPEEMTAYQATAQVFDSATCRVLPSFPCFLYPTQGAQKYDAQRAEEYRALLREGEPIPPVLAYALDASISVLLDGHHRACACALEGVRVPCLTISRPARYWRERIPHLVWPDEHETPLDQTMTRKQQTLWECPIGERLHRQPPSTRDTITFRRPWEPAYAAAVRLYPTCEEAGALALYPNLTLDAESLRLLASDPEEVSMAVRLLRYAARQPGADPKALARALLARTNPACLRKAAYEVLTTVKNDPEIDDLMVEVLVNCEQKDDPIYQIAINHWES